MSGTKRPYLTCIKSIYNLPNFYIMDISINTPALLFPAITLVMLAYTNRYIAIASTVRSLHDNYGKYEDKRIIHGQIKSLRYRLKLIKNMQILGVFSFLCCIICMYFIYSEIFFLAHFAFAVAIISFAISLLISLNELNLSTKAIELELSDIEGLENPSVIEYIKKKFEKDQTISE